MSDSFATPWTVARQAPLSMEFPSKNTGPGLPFPTPGESSLPRDQTQVFCTAGRFYTIWATEFTHIVCAVLDKAN